MNVVDAARADRNGQDIANVGKSCNFTNKERTSHKISFRDKVQTGTRVCDVHLVESYKKYNAAEMDEDTIICRCSIF